MKDIRKFFSEKIYGKPTFLDATLLSLFAVAVTLQPFLFQNEINLSELSLYLPGINAVLEGMVPYRDFFHLRGPLEIYLPAGLMLLFGVKVSILTIYFTIGNVFTLVLSVFIAKEIIRTRYIFALMSLVLIARTFPRVMFFCWGGMRYAFGLMAILAIVYFFKKRRYLWLILSGVLTALGGLTSIEIGVGAFIAIFGALLYEYIFIKKRESLKDILHYCFAIGMVILPFFAYLHSVNALFPYGEAVYTIVTQMEKVIDLRVFSNIPRSLWDVLPIMFNPLAKNFRHVTPAYLYIFLLGFIVYRHVKKDQNSRICPSVIVVGLYGFFLFATAFRNIWGSQLEMALQPEKILLFFLIEQAYLPMREQMIIVGKRLKSPHMFKKNIWVERLQYFGIAFLLVGLFMSSLGYVSMRYNRRFTAWKVAKYQFQGKDTSELSPLHGRLSRALNLPRAGKVSVPLEQAHELEDVVHFIQDNTREHEEILIYPEAGYYYFFFDRPFLHKFPIATFSWFKDQWHREFVNALKKSMPNYAILPRELDVVTFRDYFANIKNKEKYDEVMSFINANYSHVKDTERSMIYKKIEGQKRQ